MSIHIYASHSQPAVRYKDSTFDPPRWFKNKPHSLIRCLNCQRLRRAKNMRVRVYYDCRQYFCASKDDCKKKR